MFPFYEVDKNWLLTGVVEHVGDRNFEALLLVEMSTAETLLLREIYQNKNILMWVIFDLAIHFWAFSLENRECSCLQSFL
jgi:hypothetical protein